MLVAVCAFVSHPSLEKRNISDLLFHVLCVVCGALDMCTNEFSYLPCRFVLLLKGHYGIIVFPLYDSDTMKNRNTRFGEYSVISIDVLSVTFTLVNGFILWSWVPLVTWFQQIYKAYGKTN